MILDVLLSPALLLGLVVALMCAALFHIVWGRTLRHLCMFCLASIVGLALGQTLARFTALPWLVVGELHLLEGIICAVLALFVAKRLKL